jgi:hypothetical protein
VSRRTTRCLTWGEMRHSGETIRDENGKWLAHLSFAEYVTLCGRQDEEDDPSDAGAYLDRAHSARPLGVCRACWRRFRADVCRVETGITGTEDLVPVLATSPAGHF